MLVNGIAHEMFGTLLNVYREPAYNSALTKMQP
jgi:hypothetical protein